MYHPSSPSPNPAPGAGAASRVAPLGATTLHAALSDPRRYARQIERLHAKYLQTRELYELEQEGVSLASLVLNRRRVARLIARAVARGEYALEPARLRTLRVDGKARAVVACPLTDLLVHGVVSDVLQEAVDPLLSPCLYSYRRGLSWYRGVADFAGYVRAHRRSRPDPRTRGLYVLRRDIEAYTDAIPVGETSPLWPMLHEALERTGTADSLTPDDWRLVRAVVRPRLLTAEGAPFTRWRGAPTGQPIACVLFNLYLAPFDRELDRIPEAFYARYCDDILFAHPDPAVARAVDARIDALLAGLWLRVNPDKSRTLYLTGAGRPSAAWPEARGTTAVPFLGTRVAGDGTVSLSPQKRRRLLVDLRERARRTAAVLGPGDPDARGRAVCAVINRALNPRAALVQQRSAGLLRRAVTNRQDLRQLDYWIARIVLRAVTGARSVRAFRRIAYRTVRERWGLVSLLHARDRWAR
jgi:hypothetical protein